VFSFSMLLNSPFAICLYACCYRADVAKQRDCHPKANNDIMFIYYVAILNLCMCTYSLVQTLSLITGYFNGWHPSWGHPRTNTRGETTQRLIDNKRLILLNNKSPTHFSTLNTYTHIDLTLCSPILAPHAKWKILNDLHGSDHFPIITTLFPQPIHKNSTDPFLNSKKPTGNSSTHLPTKPTRNTPPPKT